MSWVPDSTQLVVWALVNLFLSAELTFPNAFCMEKVIISRSSYLPKLQVYIRSAMLLYACHEKWHSNITKCCPCHQKWRCNITKVFLCLPRKVTVRFVRQITWSVILGGRFEHDSSMNGQVISHPLSPRLLFTLCGSRIMEKEWRRQHFVLRLSPKFSPLRLQCACHEKWRFNGTKCCICQEKWHFNIPKCCAGWEKRHFNNITKCCTCHEKSYDLWHKSHEASFTMADHFAVLWRHFVWKKKTFLYFHQMSGMQGPTSRNAAPATRRDPTSPNYATPATKSISPTSPNLSHATKSDAGDVVMWSGKMWCEMWCDVVRCGGVEMP